MSDFSVIKLQKYLELFLFSEELDLYVWLLVFSSVAWHQHHYTPSNIFWFELPLRLDLNVQFDLDGALFLLHHPAEEGQITVVNFSVKRVQICHLVSLERLRSILRLILIKALTKLRNKVHGLLRAKTFLRASRGWVW